MLRARRLRLILRDDDFRLQPAEHDSADRRVDRGVAIAQSSGLIYALFDAEYQSPDYDYGLARLAIDHIFDANFE